MTSFNKLTVREQNDILSTLRRIVSQFRRRDISDRMHYFYYGRWFSIVFDAFPDLPMSLLHENNLYITPLSEEVAQ